MPVRMLQGIAKKAGTTHDHAEKIWDDSKKIVDKKFSEDDPSYYPYLTGIVKRRLGLSKGEKAMFDSQDSTNEEADVEETAKKNWSQEVTDNEKFHPKEGIFKQSSEKIAKYLLSKGKGKAMSRLTFYINRAGKSLSPEDRNRLERAKKIISNATGKETAKAHDYTPQYKTPEQIDKGLRITDKFFRTIYFPKLDSDGKIVGYDEEQVSSVDFVFLQSDPDTDPVWTDPHTSAVVKASTLHHYMVHHATPNAQRRRRNLLQAYASATNFNGPIMSNGSVTAEFMCHMHGHSSIAMAEVSRSFEYHNRVHAGVDDDLIASS